MTERIRTDNRHRFTLVVMMVVIATIAILMTIAIPMYNRFVVEARENMLQNTLLSLRSAIDSYAHDKGKRPQSLQALAAEGYLQKIPMDPMVGNSQSWRTIMEEAAQSVNQSEPGIFDVKTGSDKIGLDGTPYSDW